MGKKLTTVISLTGLIAGLALAQRQGGTPPDPQTMIQRRVDRLATELSLTDAQKTQATTIFTDAFTATQSIQSDMHTNRQSLSAAIKKNDTATITALAAASGTLSGQLTAINSKAEATFYAILTADQQTKYDAQPHGGPGGPMGPGGFGPGRSGARRGQ